MNLETLHQKWLIELKKGFAKPLILQIISNEPTYPYFLAKQIAEKSHGMISLVTSNLYPILKSMIQEGLVSMDHDENSRRTIYTITTKGQALLSKLKESIGEIFIIFDRIMDFNTRRNKI
jgi:DNA-binding PadR family transcriptional regulator